MLSLRRSAWALEKQCILPASRRFRSIKSKQVYFNNSSGAGRYDVVENAATLRNIRTGLVQESTSNPRWQSPSRNGPQSKRYHLFWKLVEARFNSILRDFGSKSNGAKELAALGIHSKQRMVKEAQLFKDVIEKSFQLASVHNTTGRQENPYFWSWRNAFIRGDTKELSTELKYSFTSFIVRQGLSTDAITSHDKMADFRFPYEWFPATRTMQRTIHLHVGPTNSGKTYNALQALEAAKTGIYAGPLRLLAHEVYSRMSAKKKRCALITGEEQRIPEGDKSYFSSCTVEMTPLNSRVDVAVIDEIQMIGDPDRGWAWTQAFLGVQAKEVHLCGEERAVPLIESLCARIGDKCVVHKYKRLSSLQPMQESLGGDFSNLRKGDAVVSFSRVTLHGIKAGIEKMTGRKCAIVYGSLPPESRAQQAALFNDPNNDYDYLAASDAIGMGLNLEIKRVVFESVQKNDGTAMRALTIPETRQIGGRAGRYKTANADINESNASNPSASPTTLTTTAYQASAAQAPNAAKWGQAGFVTTLEEEDLDHVHEAFTQEAEPLKTAGVFPPTSVIERFSAFFPVDTPFSFILLRLRDIAKISARFHMCSCREMIAVSEIIQEYNLSIYDRCIFLTAPISLRDPGMIPVLKSLARCVADMSGGELLKIKEINLEILDLSKDAYPGGPPVYLRHLEALHKSITLYLWLSYRYIGVFQSQPLAFHVKSLVEAKIDAYLEELDYQPEARQKALKQTRKTVKKHLQKTQEIFTDYDVDEVGPRQTAASWNEAGHEEPLFPPMPPPVESLQTDLRTD